MGLQIETADNAHCNQQLRNRTQQLDSTQKELEQLQKQMLAVIDMPGCHKDLAAALKESQRRKEEIIKLQALVAQLRKSLSYRDDQLVNMTKAYNISQANERIVRGILQHAYEDIHNL